MAEKWNQWCEELPKLHRVAIPRWYKIETQSITDTVKLHIYCDASEKAYSAVAYLQGQNEGGEVVTTLLASITSLGADGCTDWSEVREQSSQATEHGKKSA